MIKFVEIKQQLRRARRYGEGRFPLTSAVRDVGGLATVSAAVTAELLAAGAVGAGRGRRLWDRPGSGAAGRRIQHSVWANQSAADNMSGCTAAELADPAVIKSPTPVYGPGRCWNHRGPCSAPPPPLFLGNVGGRRTPGRVSRPTTAAILYRDDDFGQPNRDGLSAQFVALGGTVLATAGHANAATTTLALLKTPAHDGHRRIRRSSSAA